MSQGLARYHIGGLDCAVSASEIQAAIDRLPGVKSVELSVTAGTMSVRYDGQLPAAAIDHAVKWLGQAISPSPQIFESGPTLPDVRASDQIARPSWLKSARHASRWFV